MLTDSWRFVAFRLEPGRSGDRAPAATRTGLGFAVCEDRVSSQAGLETAASAGPSP